MELLTIPKDDWGYNLPFLVTDSEGEVKDLSGYTIKLKMWKPGVPGTLLLNGSVTTDDAEAGTCHYTILENDFDTIGSFHAELELIASRESTEPFIIYVVESG